MTGNNNLLSDILEKVSRGSLSPDEAYEVLGFDNLKKYSFVDLDSARVDTHRSRRCGVPEAIFCRGKELKDIVRIAKEIVADGNPLIATKATGEIFDGLKSHIPDCEYFPEAGMVIARNGGDSAIETNILIVTAGTSDIPVARECFATLRALGIDAGEVYDVGVAGIHRLIDKKEVLENADIIIVVAGMDGVLPSAVSGLVKSPVIAVPTSVGYGASFGGLAALLTMLNSCAPGISVVNIDNGFGAACAAYKIALSGKRAS